MSKHRNPPTMQTIQRADGQLYHTLNVQRLKNASPLQTVISAQRRLGLVSLILIAIIVALLALALMVGNANAQTCQIGSAPVPAPLPAGGEGLGVGTCIQPRAYLPLIDAGVLLPR